MQKTKLWIAIGVCGLALSAVFIKDYQEVKNVKFGTYTTHSPRSTGLSVFYRLMELHGQSIQRFQQPILKTEELEQFDTLMIFSPSMAISTREAKKVKAYVEQGGRLILSFHDRRSWLNLRSILTYFELDRRVKNEATFQNQESLKIWPDQNIGSFEAGKKYQFYSRMIFDDAECKRDRFLCYVREAKVGEGRVELWSGLPPLNNALISKDANAQLAEALAKYAGKIGVDEYHHFFADKDFWDLLGLPEVWIPLAGMILMMMIYFIFGGNLTDLNRHSDSSTGPRISYHDINQGVLEKAVSQLQNRRDALMEHREFLIRIYPRFRVAIDQKLGQVASPDKVITKKQFHEATHALIKIHTQIAKRTKKWT